MAVYDGSDTLLQRFEYADGRMPVAMTVSGQIYYFAYDQVGSLRVVTDNAGNVVKRVDYDSFGNILSDSNPAFTVPFGFAGGLHGRDTGLVRFGARDYDPATGKWTAKDPIDFAGGDLNLGSYVGQDPVNRVDLNGLDGIAIDFGGNWSTGWGGPIDPNTTISQGSAAGTGFYINSVKGAGGITEIGGFTYQSRPTDLGIGPNATFLGGANFTVFFTDAADFFSGKLNYVKTVIGPIALVHYIDPCTNETVGFSIGFLGKGFGLALREKGVVYGLDFPAQSVNYSTYYNK